MAAALQQRSGSSGAVHRARRRSVRRRRRHAAAVPVRAVLADARRDVGAAVARQAPRRSGRPIASCVRTPGAGDDSRAGTGGDGSADVAARARISRVEHRQDDRRPSAPRQGGVRRSQHARCAPGDGGVRVAHSLRQRRQCAPRPRVRSPARDRGPRGPRRLAARRCSPTADGEPGAVARGLCCRARPRAVRYQLAVGAAASRQPAAAAGV